MKFQIEGGSLKFEVGALSEKQGAPMFLEIFLSQSVNSMLQIFAGKWGGRGCSNESLIRKSFISISRKITRSPFRK